MDVTNPKSLDRLYRAIQTSFRNLITYRQSSRRLIKQYAGSDYAHPVLRGNSIKGPLPTVNLIHQTAEAYTQALAYNCPRFNITTWRPDAKSFVEKWKIALNNLVHMIRLEIELQPVILDAFIRVGRVKLLLPDSPRVMTDSDPYIEQGPPYVARVGGDNWVHDTICTDIRRAGFLGDKYLMRMEDIAKSDIFPSSFYNRLVPIRPGDNGDEYERSSTLSTSGYDQHEVDIDDMVELADIYLPRERLIITVPVNHQFIVTTGARPLVREWTGGETGPYHLLTFADVPDNAMPMSIAENLYGLCALYNNLLMKAASRALKEKDVAWYTAAGADDMKRITHAGDMVPVRIDHKDSVGTFKMGGADSQLLLFDMNVQEIFNRQAGNIDMMLGLAPSAPTASQEAQLGQAVSGKQAQLRRRTNDFVSGIGEGLSEIMWHNPDLFIPGTREPVPGLGPIDASWYPPDLMPRIGDFRDYNMPVEAYSMEYKSPQQRLNNVMSLMQTTMPMMPLLQQMGSEFDGPGFVQKISELADSPEFASFWRHNGLPQQSPEGNSPVGANQPREYIRTNVAGGATGQGRQQQMMQAMGRATSNGSNAG